MPHLRRHRTLPPRAAPATADSATQVHPGDQLCGYRVVRKLGDATRAEVYLGFSESTLESSEPSTAAIKVYRPQASRESIRRELEALTRASHPHVVRLADVATTTGGLPCLVLERLARGSLVHLLEQRPSLSMGEAVTILAPLAAAVDAIHASGVVHGAIGAQAVMFRESGAPVLARFGRSLLVDPGRSDAALALDEGVAADRAALAELTRLVLSRTGTAATVPEPTTDRYGEALATALFALATPVAVRFAPDAPQRASAVPARVGTRAAFTLPGEPEAGVRDRGRAIAAALMAQARTVRRPVWVAVASVVVALIAAIVLIPGEEPRATAEPQPTDTPIDAAPIVDDPIAALSALVAARTQCISAVSVLCLDAVDQQGSQAFDADAQLIVDLQNGAEIPDATALENSTPALVERLGDTALISLGAKSEPASVLLVKTEAGWRIRDYLE